MPNYRAQCSIVTADNVAANFATNTLYFEADNDGVLPAIDVALDAFYDDIGTGFGSLVKSADNLIIKWYDMADPEPRVPVRETTLTVTRTATACLPPEVALVMSFQGVAISGTPQARRRGRIYIPFVNTSQMGADGRPNSIMVDRLSDAGGDLKTASTTATDWTWQVYSPTSGGYIDVANGWVDNEFDTQRRRGRPATSRNTF